MGVDLELAFIERDVADERDDFYLFIKVVLKIVLLLQVKIPKSHIAEGANPGAAQYAAIVKAFVPSRTDT